ncbi:EpsG family protein [Lacticaseibacillus sp. 53-4]|uniref:EpsG family protein n=1 Tax=Lacticaseibacillus sp. 53-4 TaxID=2799575 RepID=UPI0019451890|nr:EpsG family protein [Lacticaseibacillus sp. 53-4]
MLFLASEALQFVDQFAKRKSQLIGGFGLLVLGYLAAFTSPMHNLDYQTYQAQYVITAGQPAGAWKFERGYSYLSVLFYKLGLSYQTFRTFLCLMAIIVLYMGVRRFTTNTPLFVGIYGATVFLLDATQLRNFIMLSFVILAISFLQEKNVKNYLIATFIILLSAQFHSLGYLFLLVVVLRLMSFNFLYKYALWLVGAVVGVIMMINVVGVQRISKLVGRVLALVSSRANIGAKLASQYGNGSILIRYVAVGVSSIAAFLLIWFLYKVVATSQDKKLINQFQLIYTVVLMSMLTLPTLSLADDYSRIPRSIFLVVIIGIAIYYEHQHEFKVPRMSSLINLLIFLVCAMNGFSHLYMWGTYFRGSLLYLIKLA